MSVTVKDIMRLPCMNGAKVVAGMGGMSKALSTVSVLEYADPSTLQEELFHNDDFSGSEIVITAFANIANEVDLQCANIKRLSAAGEIGLILYYVGIFMPAVDQRLIDLANQLDFVLIVMPEKRMDLRYSEVITEVMEAIIRDQATEISLLSDVLEQIGRLPEHQRTMDAVLRMARDRIRTSLVLVDSHGRTLGQANWPMSLSMRIDDYTCIKPMTPVSFPDGRTIWRCPLNQADSQSMELYLIKEGTPNARELVLQTLDLVRLAVSIWSSKHAEVQISELIKAILRDEPIKMRRLADLFHIDVASMHSMWVLRVENTDISQRKRFVAESLVQLQERLTPYCDTVIADVYEGYIVCFMTWRSKDENVTEISSELMRCLSGIDIKSTLVRCQGLTDTADVRHSFLLIKEHMDDVKCIWPTRQNFSFKELTFVSQCRKTVEQGDEVLAPEIKPLKLLEDFSEGAELVNTLSVYLLDADSSVARCADLLFLHKNTVKYRLSRICACLEHHVDKEPEKFFLYRAVVINRLLGKGI